MRSAVEMSHLFLREALHPQAICVDATLGHGKDAQFFLEQGCRQVIAFEIQEDVLTDTIQRIADPRLEAYCQGHETMDAILSQKLSETPYAVIPGFYGSLNDGSGTSKGRSRLSALKRF